MRKIPENEYDGHHLVLNRDGLFVRDWDQGKNREYHEKKIASAKGVFASLDKILHIEDGVRLSDLFKILTIGNCCEKLHFGFPHSWLIEYVEKYKKLAKKGKIVPWKNSGNANDIEYLEVYWHAELDDDYYNRYGKRKMLYPLNRPDFHGIGFTAKEAVLDNWGNTIIDAGHRLSYGVEYSPIENTLDIPLKINPSLIMYDSTDSWKPVGDELVMPMTLQQVIYGVFWELSWGGGPENK